MTNLKIETHEVIKESGHKPSDVMFIGSKDGKYRLNIDEFDKVSNFEYDSGYGGQEIASDLIIYFNDNSYIVRGEYDGSEWWEYNYPLKYKKSDKSKPYNNLKAEIGWRTVEELQNITK